MSGRALVMIGSVLLAGGVLGAAAWLGAAPPVDDGGPATNPAVTPTNLEGLDIRPEDLTGGQRLELESIELFEVFQDDGKTITRLYGTKAVPRDDFVADIIGPGAEITFAPERVLTITAAQGTFYYPGRQPQRGDFHRDTVVTLYEARPGETVDMHSDRHVQMRLFLDDPTHFDREQGQVRTDGPVRLVGRDIDFTGRGLSLTFNAGQQRVEQLVIDRGEQLRLAAGGEAPATPADAPTTGGGSAPAPAPGDAATPPDGASANANTNTNAESEAEADPAPAGQAYLVTLDGGVDVTVGADGTTLLGETLRGSFVVRSDDSASDAPTPAQTASAADSAAAAAPHPGMQAAIVADTPAPTPTPDAGPASGVAAAAPPPIDANDPRALRVPRPDDTVVTWGGRLVLKPDPLPGGHPGGNDTRLVLQGGANGPARVSTRDAQSLTAARVGYDAASGRVSAHARDGGPAIALDAPDMGRLTARGLELSQTSGVGVISGPGRLDTDDGRLAVAFTERLDLSFTTTDQAAGGHALGGLEGLREAVFVGNVEADATDEKGQPALSLRADRLAVPFTRDAPAAAAGKAQPEPASRPAALIASVDPSHPDRAVTVTLPDTDLRARELTVDLARAQPSPPPPGTAPPSADDADLGGLDVARLRARGAVAVQLEGSASRLTAHALDADPARQRLELFGQADAPALLVRRGARLQGAHLILREAEQAAEALGPGHFSTPTDTNAPGGEIRVAWTGGMTFENQAGRASFTGDVVSDAHADESRSRLTAHALSIDFVPQNLDAADQARNEDEGQDGPKTPRPPAANRDGQAAGDAPTRNALDIRRLHAVADPLDRDSLVNFTTQTLDGPPDGEEPQGPPLTAFTLISRELSFINVVPNLDNDTAVDDRLTLQTVEVPGRGRMLISDHRTPAPAQDRAVAFAGAGLTAFAWEGRLTLDALQNDLRMEGDVLMAHEPLAPEGAAPDPPVKLEAQVLTADLTETGGLGALAGGPAPDVQLRRVVGAGAVRISRDQARVLADHLDYTATRGNVILTAEPGKLCELRQADQPTSATTARRLLWDLDTGIFTAQGVGGGVVPVQ